MRLISKDLTLLSLALCTYFAAIMIKQELLCFVFAGMFYGLLSKTGRRVLFSGLLLHNGIEVIQFFFWSKLPIYVAFDMMKKALLLLNSSYSTKALIPLSNALNYTFTGSPAGPLIGVGLLVITIVIFIVMIPYILLSLAAAGYFLGLLILLRPLLLPSYTLNELNQLAAKEPELFLDVMVPVLPWIVVVTGILMPIMIPLASYLFLKKIGFYKRIPKIRAFN